MRSVFVFPAGDPSVTRTLLDSLTGDDGPWMLPADDGSGPAVYVRLATPDPVEWGAAELDTIGRLVGRGPDWTVVGDVSGRVPGHPEVRRLVLALLAAGGVALDDLSDHPWTAAEIGSDARVDGRGFLDDGP